MLQGIPANPLLLDLSSVALILPDPSYTGTPGSTKSAWVVGIVMSSQSIFFFLTLEKIHNCKILCQVNVNWHYLLKRL